MRMIMQPFEILGDLRVLEVGFKKNLKAPKPSKILKKQFAGANRSSPLRMNLCRGV